MLDFLATLFVGSAGHPYFTDDPGYTVATAISADTLHGATFSGDGLIRLWDFPLGSRVRARLVAAIPTGISDQFHTEPPTMVMTADGRRFCVVSESGMVQMWEAKPPKLIRAVQLKPLVTNAFWTPSGNRLFVENEGQTTVISTSGRVSHLPVSAPWVFTRGEDELLAESSQGPLLMNLRNHQVLRKFSDNVQSMDPLVLSPDGKYLITGSEDPNWKAPDIKDLPGAPTPAIYFHQLLLKIWRIRDGKLLKAIPGFGSDGQTPEIFFTSRHRFVAPGMGKVIDCPSGRVVKEYIPLLDRTEAFPLREALPGRAGRVADFPPHFNIGPVGAWSRDGKRLAASGFGRGSNVAEWSLDPLRIMDSTHIPSSFPPNNIFYTPGDRLLEIVRSSGLVRDMTFARNEKLSGHVSPDGKLLFSAKGAGADSITVTSLTSQKIMASYPTPRFDSVPLTPSKTLYSLDGAFGIAFAFITYPARETLLARVDAMTGKVEWAHHFQGSTGLPALSDNGKFVLVVRVQEPGQPMLRTELDLLSAKTGESVASTPLVREGRSIDISADSKRVLVAGHSTIDVFEVPSLHFVGTIPIHESSGIHAAVFSHDGNRVAQFSGETGVTVYDVATGRLRATLLRYGERDWVAWTPAGDVAGSQRGIAHLCRLNSGRIERAKREKNPSAVAIAFQR